MEPKTVEVFGTKERVGDWVVIDNSMTKVLASDATPEAALRKAHIDPKAPRPILMQVMDPALTCLF
jgi:hypothetical protein